MHFIHQINNINSMEGIRNEGCNLEQKNDFTTFCPRSKILDFEKLTKIIPGITT